MKVFLIRHGKTQGNLEHRYIGARTDESLCKSGREALADCKYSFVTRVFVSSMKRAIESAEILFPGASIEIVEGLQECDFGEFEGHNYAELNGREDYQKWIDSGGEIPFPGGESRAEFAARCVKAFQARMADVHEDCAFVVHGGTIMAIMEACAVPKGNYFDFQVKNGEGYVLYEDGTYEKMSGETICG